MAQWIGSTTPLPGGGTYTSRWVDTDYFGYLAGSVFSDQAGTLYIEQSGDQINADISANYAVTGGAGEGYIEQLLLPWVRLRYVNGATPQTALRLFSRFIIVGMP